MLGRIFFSTAVLNCAESIHSGPRPAAAAGTEGADMEALSGVSRQVRLIQGVLI